MTDKASYALLHGFGNVAIALAIGYVFYKLIRTKDTPTKVSDYGRNWLAWMVLIATMAGLPNVIMKPSPDTIFKFIAPLVIFSLIAFVFGLIYGKFKLPKKALNNSSVEVEKQPNTTLDNQTSGSGINCSSCGAEITPKGAKFCKHCGAKVGQVITTSAAVKAEAIKPPTIEKKIVDEVKIDKADDVATQHEANKKIEKPLVHKDIKPSSKSNQARNTLILLSIFVVVVIVIVVFSKSDRMPVDYKTVYAYIDLAEEHLKDKNTSSGVPINESSPVNKNTYGKSKVSMAVWGNTHYSTYAYNGELRDGIPHGIGTATDTSDYGDDRVVYKGEWKNGERHGYGIGGTSFGAQYKGEWKNGKRHGVGSLTSKMKTSYDYTGEWKYDWPNGLGTKTLNNGYQIKGMFKNGKKVEFNKFEKEQDTRSLKKEIQTEEGQEREIAQEDILNELKANYINQIASRVKEQWRYQGAKDNWGCDVYILQDLNGKVQSVNLQSCNVTNSAKAKVFKDAIERAVYKASPLPPAPDKSVYDREILFHFRVN